MIRAWVKILPYFVVEWIICRRDSLPCKLDNSYAEAWRIRDGVYLVKNETYILQFRKKELERELAQITADVKTACRKRTDKWR